MIIGITGTLGAGKGVLSDILKSKGFEHYSVREFIVDEIKKRGMEVNRDSMVIVANGLREKKGVGYIVEQLYDRAEGDAVIESLRTVGEVEALRKKRDFVLFSIDADAKMRFERVKGRGSVTDDIDFGTFLENEKREMHSDDPNKQNIAAVMAISDYQFENNGTMDELKEKVEEVLEECLE